MANAANSIVRVDRAKESLIKIGVAYMSPALAFSFLFGPILVLQGIYAKTFGLALTHLAVILLIIRLFDAITDPIIGYISDSYYSRYKTRKPFMLIGAFLFLLGGFFLYIPPDAVDASYFLRWSLVFYLGWTLFEIPHITWGGALTPSSQDRNSIYGMRAFGMYSGKMLFFLVPLLPFFETNEITLETLKYAMGLGAILIIPALSVCITNVPNSYREISNPSQYVEDLGRSNEQSFAMLISMIINNRPFLLLITAYFLFGVGAGMWSSLLFIYVDTYLKLGDDFSMVYMFCLAGSLVSLFFWHRFARQVDKRIAWAVAMIIIIIGILGMAFITSGSENVVLLLILMMASYSGGIACNTLTPSLLSDIIDFGILKFGVDRSATYFSIYTFVGKSNYAVGGALGLAIAGFYGYDASSEVHSSDAVFGLRLAISFIPALILLFAIGFILLIPLTTKKHSIIRRRLAARSNANF